MNRQGSKTPFLIRGTPGLISIREISGTPHGKGIDHLKGSEGVDRDASSLSRGAGAPPGTGQ